MSKKILMIAGPNGAGKTTATFELIAQSPNLYEFLNADEIAKGLAPRHPESMALTASKLMIQRLKELLGAEKSFAFETTASGTNYLKHLKHAQTQGYEIHLTFLWLSNPQQAVKRVAQRVMQGGHHVDTGTITRRYYSGIKNVLNLYLPLVDTANIIDVSSGQSEMVAIKNIDQSINILKEIVWREMEQIADV